MASVNHVLRQQFIKEGFALFREVLEPDLVGELRAWSDGVLGEQEAAHFEQNRTTGSMVLIDWAMAYRYSVLAELIAHPRVLAALGALGFAEPKFGHGRIISKPPQSPPLFWHEDGRFWDDPVSYTWQPDPVFSDVLSDGYGHAQRLFAGSSGGRIGSVMRCMTSRRRCIRTS